MKRRRGIRLPEASSRVRRDVDDEVAFHIQSRTADLVRGGVPEGAARQQALSEFGDVDAARDQLEDLDRSTLRVSAVRRLVTEWRDDVVAAKRALTRRPSFACGVGLIMALGIAASTSMFSLVDRLMLRAAPHVRDPEGLAHVYHTFPSEGGEVSEQVTRSFVDLQSMVQERALFRDVGAYFATRVSVGEGAEGREIPALITDAGFYRVLGVSAAVGRVFTPDETGPADASVVLLSHGYWQREFGGRTNVLGSVVHVFGRPYTVIGVMPPRFRGIGLSPVDVFLPVNVRNHWAGVADQRWATEVTWQWLNVVVRLTAGVTREQAGAKATGIFRAVHSSAPFDQKATVQMGSVLPGRGPGAGRESRVAVLLLIVSVLLLAIATANVAVLMLNRAVEQRRESLVRIALGISARRLGRQLVLESVVLCGIAASAAVLLTRWSGAMIRGTLFPSFEQSDLVVDGRLIALALVIALGTGIVLGLAPLTAFWRHDLARDLRTGGRDGSAGGKLRAGLVGLQATLTALLAVGAALFGESLRKATSVDLGFDADKVQFVSADVSRVGEGQRLQLLRDLASRAGQHPSVASVTLSTTVPFWMNRNVGVHVPGRDSALRFADGWPSMTAADPTYHKTLGIALRRGRALLESDVAGAPRVAVVNQVLVDSAYPGVDPLGKCLYLEDAPSECTTIVGVMGNTRRYTIRRTEGSAQMVVSLAQFPSSRPVLLVRGAQPKGRGLEGLAQDLRAVDGRVGVVSVRGLSDLIEPQVRTYRVGATLLVLFGSVALLLSALGLYSTVAYDAGRRAHELGVRMALGAQPSAVAWSVVRRAVVSATAGVACGLLVAGSASGLVKGFLFQTSPTQPLLLLGAVVVVCAVAAFATLPPAVRALKADPLKVLRAD